MADVTPQLQAAVALHQAGRLDEAAAGYVEILKTQPQHADALHLLGMVAFQNGDHTEALRRTNKAIAIDPGAAMYHANRGRILKAVGRNDDAAAAFSQSLRLHPGDPAALSDLAGALIDAGNPEAAQHFAIRAAELAPGLAPAFHNMGLAALALGEPRPARAAFEHAVEVAPGLAAAHFELGRLSQADGDADAAAAHYRQAVEHDPDLLEAHTNLGNLLRGDGQLEDAVDCYRRAIALDAGLGAVHGNLGVALQELGDPSGALAAYDRALELDPEDAETQRNRAQVLLLNGDYGRGWPAFESRWQTLHFAAIRRDWAVPQWRGEPALDATLLVHAEQGFGDTLQFARYLPMVAERVGRVVVECPTPVAGLVARVGGVDDVLATGAPLPAMDLHVPMMSLPLAFGTTLSDIPAEIPYLSVPEDARALWAGRIIDDGRLRVGVVWKGSHHHQRNRWRSPGLDVLRPILESSEIAVVSLQKDDETTDLAEAGLAGDVLPLGHEFRNFSDTAAAVENLDLVITPDTAVAHLAGGLGTPVWLMLPHVAEWRWLMDRDDSPWYPGMRLFRQARRGAWQATVSAMCDALTEMVRERAAL